MVKFRMYTCKIILATSLVWFVCGALLLMYYTDCIGDNNSPACQSLRKQKANSIPIQTQRFIKILQPSTTAIDDNFKFWNPVGKIYSYSFISHIIFSVIYFLICKVKPVKMNRGKQSILAETSPFIVVKKNKTLCSISFGYIAVGGMPSGWVFGEK